MAVSPAPAQIIPVLLYHSVALRPSTAIAPYAVSPEMFERQVDMISEGGHSVLTVDEMVDRLQARQALPPHAVVVTFDDGFADNLEVVAPILRARGMRATVYITTGYLSGKKGSPGRPSPGRMLSWEGLSELEAAGLSVGAHSHTHPQLDVLRKQEALAEVLVSKILLEDRLGHAVRSFAYPHGCADLWVRDEVRRAGFDSACGVRNALSHSFDNRWFIARLTVRNDTPLERMGSWLRGIGAPVAGPREAVTTWAWRRVRRLRRQASRQRSWDSACRWPE